MDYQNRVGSKKGGKLDIFDDIDFDLCFFENYTLTIISK